MLYTLVPPGMPPSSGGTVANSVPSGLASPAARRTCQLPLTGSTLVGMRTTNERDCRLTSVWRSAFATGWPLPTSSSSACWAETINAYWMPDELTPAFAGQALPAAGVGFSVLNVHSAIGTFGETSVFQATRQELAAVA